MSGAMETARTAWGDPVPDWIVTLVRECEASSQNKVAGRMKYSGAVISQVLRAKYPGDMEAVEDRVRGLFMQGRVNCPALGTLPVNECRDWRALARSFSPVNALRVRMFRACTRCPRHVQKETAHE